MSSSHDVDKHLEFIWSEANDLEDPRWSHRPPTDAEVEQMFQAYHKGLREKQEREMIRLTKVIT